MQKLCMIIGVLTIWFGSSPASAQTPGGEPGINVEGSLRGERSPEHRGEPGGRGEGGSDRSTRSGNNSSSAPSVTMPTIYVAFDVGAPPLPPQGYQVHKVQYGDGSFDVVRVYQREGTFKIDHHDSTGTRVGGQSGSVAGYPGGTYSPMMMAPAPPPPAWTCYTPAGPIRVNNPMNAGARCIAVVPYGTFYGTAGYP